MKNLKILVVDDTLANIKAAKIASENFPQHEFTFMTSAEEAFKSIKDFDAIITDLFFPENPSESMAEIDEEVQSIFYEDNMSVKHLAEVKKFLFEDISLSERLERNLSYIKNGSKHGFPLGLSIMIEARNKYKKLCLISSLGDGHNNQGGVDAVIILLPLVSQGILSVTTFWGNDCNYEGLTFVNAAMSSKDTPDIWEKAIHRILAQ